MSDAQFNHALSSMLRQSEQPSGGFQTNDSTRFRFLRLAKILEVDWQANRMAISWMDQLGSRSFVDICYPYVGPRARIMAMPEVNAYVIIGFLNSIYPVPLAYLPTNYPLMVELTQFPERIEEINKQVIENIKEQVKLRDDYNINAMTLEEIKTAKDYEIKARIANARLEQFYYDMEQIEPGEIMFTSVQGADLFLGEDVRLMNMNMDSLELRASDNTMLITTMNIIQTTESGTGIAGVVRRPIAIPTDQFGKKHYNIPGIKEAPIPQAMVDAQLDTRLVPISKGGQMMVQAEEIDDPLVWQFKVNDKPPLTESLYTFFEFSDNALNTYGEGAFVPLGDKEKFIIQRARIIPKAKKKSKPSETDSTSPLVSEEEAQYEIKIDDVKIDRIKDTNPFRPIENRYPSSYKETLENKFDPLSILNPKNNVLFGITGQDKSIFQRTLQEIAIVGNKKSVGQLISSSTNAQKKFLDAKRKQLEKAGVSAEKIAESLKNLQEMLQGVGIQTIEDDIKFVTEQLEEIAGREGVDVRSTDEVIKTFFDLEKEQPYEPPVGPLVRIINGTLVDGDDRLVKDPWTFYQICTQIRAQSGAFINLDRKGSANINLQNLLLNTSGMSLHSGVVFRNIFEAVVLDKYTGSKAKKIYLPYPIPASKTTGVVLNIERSDEKSDRDKIDAKQLLIARTGIGQIPNPKIPESETQFLNEFNLRIPRVAELTIRNDIADPSIIGYEAPRTKDVDLYSFQSDLEIFKKLPMKEGNNPSSTTVDRSQSYVELIAANVVDRDGKTINSSVSHLPLALQFNLNTENKGRASFALDEEGNSNASVNNLNLNTNAGSLEFGLAYKMKKKDKELSVDTFEKSQEDKPDTENTVDTEPKDPEKSTEQVDTYERTVFDNCAFLSLKLDTETTDGVRVETGHVKEIERESEFKKVGDRTITEPKTMIYESPKVEIAFGGIVDDNLTENVKKRTGHLKKNLNAQLKRIIGADQTSFEFDEEGNVVLYSSLTDKTIILRLPEAEMGLGQILDPDGTRAKTVDNKNAIYRVKTDKNSRIEIDTDGKITITGSHGISLHDANSSVTISSAGVDATSTKPIKATSSDEVTITGPDSSITITDTGMTAASTKLIQVTSTEQVTISGPDSTIDMSNTGVSIASNSKVQVTAPEAIIQNEAETAKIKVATDKIDIEAPNLPINFLSTKDITMTGSLATLKIDESGAIYLQSNLAVQIDTPGTATIVNAAQINLNGEVNVTGSLNVNGRPI